MRFGAPQALWLLVLLPALALLVWTSLLARRRRLRRFVASERLSDLAVAASRGPLVFRALLRLMAIGFIVLALGRPQWGRRDEPVVRQGVDVAICLDLSASMLTEDVLPNRLALARAEAISLLESLSGDRVALVVFGGRAAVQCPLTLDYGAVRLFLDAVEPDFSPGPGSDLGRALEEAARLFNAAERRYKTVVLLTDGEDLEGRGLEAARRARGEGIVVHAIGVGTAIGGPIPLRDERGFLAGYKKDIEGRVVTSRLDAAGLEQMALASEGLYVRANPAGEEGRRISKAIGEMEKREISSRLATRFEDRFQIPLSAALGLLGLEAAWIGRRARRRRRAEATAAESRGGTAPPPGPSAGRVDTVEGTPPPRTRVGAKRKLTGTAAIALLALRAVAVAGETFAQEGKARGDPSVSKAPTGQDRPGRDRDDAPRADEERAEPRAKAESAGAPEQSAAPRAARVDSAPAERGGEDTLAPSRSVARRNRSGNKLYDQRRYAEALAMYEAASGEAPDLPALRYNTGNALYRQGKFEAAAAEFARSAMKSRGGLAEAARYNLGNAEYQRGRYREAAEAFRRVLARDPADEDARRNLELALRALMQQQAQPQSGDESKDSPPQGQESSPRESPADQERSQEPKPGGSDGEESEEGLESGQEAQGESQRGSRRTEGALARREAEKLLDSLAEEERRDLKKRLARMPREKPKEKDW